MKRVTPEEWADHCSNWRTTASESFHRASDGTRFSQMNLKMQSGHLVGMVRYCPNHREYYIAEVPSNEVTEALRMRYRPVPAYLTKEDEDGQGK